MLNHAVVRTDNMAGTDVRSLLVSAKYFDGNNDPAAIENGNIVEIGPLMPGEREVHTCYGALTNSMFADLGLIATPEMMYDRHYRPLDDFINEPGAICRVYRLHNDDFFSVTAPALLTADNYEIQVGDVVCIAADGDTKMTVASSAPSGAFAIGRIHAIETAGSYTFYVIRVIEPEA